MRNTVTHNHQAVLDVFTTQWFAALAGESAKPLENPRVKILPPNWGLHGRDKIKKAKTQNTFQLARDIRGNQKFFNTTEIKGV